MAVPLFIPLLFGVMYFVTIRPQQRRMRAQRELVRSLQIGDEVLTAGGLIGRVVALGESEIRLDVGGSEVRLARAAVTDRISDQPAD